LGGQLGAAAQIVIAEAEVVALGVLEIGQPVGVS
jgi:hypothetical protein